MWPKMHQSRPNWNLGGDIGMTLNARERFILHMTGIMFNSNHGFIDDNRLRSLVISMLDARCNKLTQKDIEDLYLDIENETKICMKNSDIAMDHLSKESRDEMK